jgi:hypothetical protein
MFDFWYDLPPILRAGFGLLLLAVAVVLFFVSGGTRISVGLGVVGVVFLLFCKAGHDDSGYNF